MSLSQKLLKNNPFASTLQNTHTYVALMILVVGVGSFGLGRLSQQPVVKAAVSIEEAYIPQVVAATTTCEVGSPTQRGDFVASKNSDKYHYTWCSGAQRIKEENKVWFETREEAEAAGYTPASNCKGL